MGSPQPPAHTPTLAQPLPGTYWGQTCVSSRRFPSNSAQTTSAGQAACLVWDAPAWGPQDCSPHTPEGPEPRPSNFSTSPKRRWFPWTLHASQAMSLLGWSLRPRPHCPLWALQLPRPPTLKEFAGTGGGPAWESAWVSLTTSSKPPSPAPCFQGQC